MAAMLEPQNNKNYTHKNRTAFLKEKHCIVSYLQHGCRENALLIDYTVARWELKLYGKRE